jgi:hypothetical protein
MFFGGREGLVQNGASLFSLQDSVLYRSNNNHETRYVARAQYQKWTAYFI